MIEEETKEEKQEKNDESKNQVEDIKSEQKEKKIKFTFKCQQCNKCCLERGPIPITFWDLELWAKNGVVANFLPYLDIYVRPDGVMDLVLKPLSPPKKSESSDKEGFSFEEVPIEELLNEKCPLFNKDGNKCLVYENRPLSCRTYPLDFDGKNFTIVDVDCPGIGQEGMTKEELKEMRETAKTMYAELTRMRINLPVLNQIINQKVMIDLMRKNMEVMSNLSEEDKAKIDEILQKGTQKKGGNVAN
ncbi:MAG: YkgJ family cysteine cluster protein [Promethearchaeota archaeon]